MKTILKSIFSLGLITGLSFAANAQITTANANATSTATILTDITIAKDVDIAFGNVQTGTTPTLDASDFGASSAIGATATLGKFTVSGTPTANVLVEFTTLVTMSNEDDSDDLDFIPSVWRTALTAATDGEVEIADGGTYVINNSATNANVGTDHFFVGGTLEEVGGGDIPASASGLYSGIFTLTVTYN